MLNNLRKLIAEKIHPEKDNVEYWILKSLSKQDLKIIVPSIIKKYGKINTKKLAGNIIDNQLFQYILDTIESGEMQYMAKEVTKEGQFFYSRAIIHVIKTIREKLNLLINLSDDEINSFDKFEVI